MNFALSTGAAFGASAFGASAFGDISCAIAPDTISALTAAEIMSFLSICSLQEPFGFRASEDLPCLRQLAKQGTCSEQLEPWLQLRNRFSRRDAEVQRVVRSSNRSGRGRSRRSAKLQPF